MIRPNPSEVWLVVVPTLVIGTIVGALATLFGLHLSRKRKQERDECLRYQQAPKEKVGHEQTASEQTKEEAKPQ